MWVCFDAKKVKKKFALSRHITIRKRKRCKHHDNLAPHNIQLREYQKEGPSIYDVGNFSHFFDPYPPYRRQFFSTIRRQIWQIFDPSPPRACRRLKWMVPDLEYRLHHRLSKLHTARSIEIAPRDGPSFCVLYVDELYIK